MKKISAIIIAKDEEEMIVDCLDSVSFCDEIVVVDGGSSDKTPEIAKRIDKVKVFIHKTPDFSELRNFGLEKASGDWVLYIDADERVSNDLIDDIKLKIASDREDISGYKVKRKNYYMGFESPKTETLERFFKKENLKKWNGRLHESPLFEGNLGNLNGFLLHYTHRSLNAMLSKTIVWSDVEADLRFKAGHPRMSWWRFPRVMVTSFVNSYFFQKSWKMGTAGLVESIYQSFSSFITYAKLWELQQKKK